VLMQTIGQLLPAAVAVALSPIPIIAIVLMLGTPKARTNGPAFAAGWVAGLVVVMVVILFVAGGSDTSSTASDTVNWFQVAIGVLFLAMARRQWGGRPKPGEEAQMPSWMATIDKVEPSRAVGLGFLLSAVNPKNLALTASAAASIAQAGLSDGDQFAAAAVFVIIGSVTVAGSVLFYLVATEKAAPVLASVKDFMAVHNAVIMMVILLILGVKILGEGLGGLSI
jgi:threonine/homoserine/homoserine lactone efflux protein